jgi:ABC-type transport system involved in Fe-S cluster assembly fused permease/ATPase subunit
MSLGYIYRSVNQMLVDTEKLLDLLNEQTEINDKPDAPDLVVNHGEIEFRALLIPVLPNMAFGHQIMFSRKR